MFDLIGITETIINDYHLYTQPSKGAAGGFAIYADNKLDHFRTEDLDTVNDEFESIRIEIRNKKEKQLFMWMCLSTSQQ